MKIAVEHDIPAALYVRAEVLVEELGPERVMQLVAEGKLLPGAKRYERKKAAAAPTGGPLTDAERDELMALNRELEDTHV